jgi:Secretion system C-terminal sorting domain
MICQLPDNGGPSIRDFKFTDINPLQVGYYQLHWMKGGKLHRSQIINAFTGEDERMSLYPNPTTGKVKIVLSNMQFFTTDVSVFDVSGKLVLN